MKKTQKTKIFAGKELSKLFDKNGDVIIKAETLKNVKAIKVVSEVKMTESQFEMIMGAIKDLDTKFTNRLDKVDQRLDVIEKDIAAMKNTPTMKSELKN